MRSTAIVADGTQLYCVMLDNMLMVDAATGLADMFFAVLRLL